MSIELSKEMHEKISADAWKWARYNYAKAHKQTEESAEYIQSVAAYSKISGALEYALLLQSEQEKRKEAEEMMERMAKDLELIVKWCNAADLKAVATDNPIHMAVYHSLHQSMQALTEFLKFKAKKDDSTNR